MRCKTASWKLTNMLTPHAYTTWFLWVGILWTFWDNSAGIWWEFWDWKYSGRIQGVISEPSFLRKRKSDWSIKLRKPIQSSASKILKQPFENNWNLQDLWISHSVLLNWRKNIFSSFYSKDSAPPLISHLWSLQKYMKDGHIGQWSKPVISHHIVFAINQLKKVCKNNLI